MPVLSLPKGRRVTKDGTPIDTFVIDKKADTTSDGAPSDQRAE
jgi:hypothetical protein